MNVDKINYFFGEGIRIKKRIHSKNLNVNTWVNNGVISRKS